MGAFPWRKHGPGLTKSQRAETGVALVDAGLREMWVSGRMHNRVCMVVTSWLTKHLVTDWRAGLAHFADCLTDWDPASNAMNWQWVAGCGPDATPYFRIFNPDLQASRYDPDAAYRRRWLAWPEGRASAEARAWLDSVPRAWGRTMLAARSGSGGGRGSRGGACRLGAVSCLDTRSLTLTGAPIGRIL